MHRKFRLLSLEKASNHSTALPSFPPLKCVCVPYTGQAQKDYRRVDLEGQKNWSPPCPEVLTGITQRPTKVVVYVADFPNLQHSSFTEHLPIVVVGHQTHVHSCHLSPVYVVHTVFTFCRPWRQKNHKKQWNHWTMSSWKHRTKRKEQHQIEIFIHTVLGLQRTQVHNQVRIF